MHAGYLHRRNFIKALGVSAAATSVGSADDNQQSADGCRVLNPLARVPLSFIIDDSTCLVNMGHFCMPQFAEAWPDRTIYKQPWKDWPREIPDAFVREFGEWCSEHGVKGKYSIVPYPACVGWLDRGLPGWSRRELDASLKLVRDLMLPNWDIHPEMITHTRVIDLKTGRPVEKANSATMENSYPQTDLSVDYLASYLALALRILKNCGLPCEGVTTPGGFGNRVKAKLPVAVHQAVRDVFSAELPHYFKYVVTGKGSTVPKLEYAGTKTVDNLTVNVPAGTGDWFGGWEGVQKSQGIRYCNEDATRGRMVELINRGEPAVMLCHWPGMYCNGAKTGFQDFKDVVLALARRFEKQTVWMKVSEIGRYYAAKELTKISRPSDDVIKIDAPLGCPQFTFEIDRRKGSSPPVINYPSVPVTLREATSLANLVSGSFVTQGDKTIVCMELKKGNVKLSI